jgi:hypothetical protein
VGVVVDGFVPFALALVFTHLDFAFKLMLGFFEFAHAFAHASCQFGDLFRTEEEEDDQEDDDHLLHSQTES